MGVGNQTVSPQQNASNQNALARSYVLANAVDEWQSIYSATLSGVIPGQVINIPVRNVGLIKRFLVQVSAQLAQSASETLTLNTFGTSAIFSQVIFTDLSNQTRHNTTGWHLQAVATAKARFPFGSSIGASVSSQATDCPYGYGTNFGSIQSAPTSITTASAPNIFAMFEIPVAYSDTDLRGAIYANVVNATMNLQLTVNPNIVTSSTATDPTKVFSMYTSSAAGVGTFTNFKVQIYQNFLDQIPIGKQGPILPALDLSTAYMLQNTTVSGLVANTDFPIPYANYRDFLSTTVIYDNAGTLNTGSDVAYWSLQAANYTNIIKLDPFTTALFGRLRNKVDFPKATYYFDHRVKPISTVQYGNLALVLNASSVTAGASVAVGYEMLALINQVTQAGSLYGN